MVLLPRASLRVFRSLPLCVLHFTHALPSYAPPSYSSFTTDAHPLGFFRHNKQIKHTTRHSRCCTEAKRHDTYSSHATTKFNNCLVEQTANLFYKTKTESLPISLKPKASPFICFYQRQPHTPLLLSIFNQEAAKTVFLEYNIANETIRNNN